MHKKMQLCAAKCCGLVSGLEAVVGKAVENEQTYGKESPV